jgi:DNA processing protein
VLDRQGASEVSGRAKHGRRGETASVTREELLGPLSELEQKYAPRKLHVEGPMGLPLPHPRVAIVGTRAPSREGLALATSVAEALARQGVVIVSGLARGIDTAAHTAAIEAGGRTIAVLGTPLSETYPPENAPLQKLIGTRHLLISQFPEGYPVSPRSFAMRNRITALVADASVIIESGESGGSLHQGWESLRLGRPLFINSHEFLKPGLKWPGEMARYGAVKFNDPGEVLESIPSSGFGLALAAIDSA